VITRAEAVAPPQLTRDSFIYLTDGPRQGDVLEAPGHTGKVCIGLAANVPPRFGSELVYEPTNIRTSDGARCYRLVVRQLAADEPGAAGGG
jgi:hypothetical protein